MNDITLMYQGIEPKEWEDNFLNLIDQVLDQQKIDNWEFSVTLCDDLYIHQINKEYRKQDKPTDVITFVMSDEPFPTDESIDAIYSAGDIIISLESVKENSLYFKVDEEEELKRVIIHGILHLNGMDHETNDESEEMLILQEKILETFSDIGIY